MELIRKISIETLKCYYCKNQATGVWKNDIVNIPLCDDCAPRSITRNELRRLCFCNSKKLLGKAFVIDGSHYEWVGIGMVECSPKTGDNIIVTDN